MPATATVPSTGHTFPVREGVAPESILVARDGVHLSRHAHSPSVEEARHHLSLPADKPMVVYAGQLYEWKGVDTLIEAMAQLSGLLAFKSKDKRHSDGVLCYLAGTDKARFKRPVVPGDQLVMRSEFKADRRGVMKFHCEAHVDGELACSADITCMVMMQDEV